MSISAAHSAAARENSAKSTGPVTPDGKATSSQNARKIGLFGPVLLLSDQEEQTYNAMLEGYLQELRPQTIIEHRHVREMVNAEWRLSLLRDSMNAYELSHIDPEAATTTVLARASAFARMVEKGNAMNLALRYERQFLNQFEKAHRALLESRRQRQAEHKAAAREEDQAMVDILHSIATAPLPDFPATPNDFLQNEPKPQPANSRNPPINPTVHVKAAPGAATQNLYKG